MNDNLMESVYDVVVSQIYIVYAQCIFSGKLNYLIDPQKNFRPNWYPAELFEVIDGSLNPNWEFQLFPDGMKDDLGALWGYSELISDQSHFNGLAERDDGALAIFARRASSSF